MKLEDAPSAARKETVPDPSSEAHAQMDIDTEGIPRPEEIVKGNKENDEESRAQEENVTEKADEPSA